MKIKQIRWPEHEVPCFHCGNDVAKWEAVLDYQGAAVNQCLCPTCINLPDYVILAKALKKDLGTSKGRKGSRK